MKRFFRWLFFLTTFIVLAFLFKTELSLLQGQARSVGQKAGLLLEQGPIGNEEAKETTTVNPEKSVKSVPASDPLPGQTDSRTAEQTDRRHKARSQTYFMTYAEIKFLEGMGFWDKLTAFSILRKLDGTESKALLKIANSGVTMEELGAVNAILQKALPAKDIRKLNSLIHKYKQKYKERNQ